MNLWHKRICHLNFKAMEKIATGCLFRGIPELKWDLNIVCSECQIGKHTKTAHKNTSRISSKRPLELLHMDLMGLMQVESITGKKYVFVCIVDYSRYS